MPCVLKCSRANVSYVLTSSHALRAYVLTCLACLRGHVLTCLACLCAQVPILLRAYVLTYLACLRAKVPCVLTCLRANVLSVLTYCSSRAYVPTCLVCLRAYVSKQKQSFQWHVFLRFEIKLYMKSAQAGMSLETFTGKYLGFECNFRFLQIPYFERQVTICDWSTQPTVVIELPLQLGSRRSQNAVKHLK